MKSQIELPQPNNDLMDRGVKRTASGVYETFPDEYEILGTKEGQHDRHVYAVTEGVGGRVEAPAKTAEPEGKPVTSTAYYTEIIPPVRPEPANGSVNDGAHALPQYADVVRS